MKRSKSKLPSIISSLFAFLLTVLFVILAFCLAGYIGIFNSRYIAKSMNDSHYYDSLDAVINTNAEKLAKEAGLSKTVLTDVITMERVYISSTKYIDSILSGQEAEIKTDSIRELLETNVDKYIAYQGFKITDDIEIKCNIFIQGVEREFEEQIQLKLVKDLYDLKLKYVTLLKFIIPILTLLIGTLCILLIKIHSRVYRGVRYITYSLIAASLLMISIWIVYIIRKPFNSLDISPEYYRNFIAAFLQWNTKMYLLLGEIGLTLALVLILFTGYLKGRVMEH